MPSGVNTLVPSINGRPTIRRLISMDVPCPHCGFHAMTINIVHEAVLDGAIVLPGSVGHGPQDARLGQGLEAHVLCWRCLHYEYWTPGDKEWVKFVLREGEDLGSADAVPAS